MCLVHIWRVLFWYASADRHAECGVSRTLLFLSRSFSRFISLWLQLRKLVPFQQQRCIREASHWFSACSYIWNQSRSKMQESSDENNHCHCLRRSRSERSLGRAESHA